ncbi:MAG: hypothetical protein II007_06840 [Gammaproteobacteria bacterium]|nr:hypothetical protein [Gammaproteobacteria bacterium]
MDKTEPTATKSALIAGSCSIPADAPAMSMALYELFIKCAIFAHSWQLCRNKAKISAVNSFSAAVHDGFAANWPTSPSFSYRSKALLAMAAAIKNGAATAAPD